MNTYVVLRNGVKIARIRQTKKAMREFLSWHLQCTHMGEWRKTTSGYEYATTIGVYYSFVKDTTKSTP